MIISLKEILLLFIGAIIGLSLNKLYEKLFERKTFEKRLRKIFLEAAKSETKKRLTVKEIISLLRKKCFNKNGEYIVCPHCGSRELKEDFITDSEIDEIYDTIKCKKCGWAGENPIFNRRKGIPL